MLTKLFWKLTILSASHNNDICWKFDIRKFSKKISESYFIFNLWERPIIILNLYPVILPRLDSYNLTQYTTEFAICNNLQYL